MEDVFTYQDETEETGVFYVYGLYRPDKETGLFYIGKGCNGRIGDHRKEAKRLLGADKSRSVKIKTIHYLWKLGLDFEEKILWDNLSEQYAFAIEEELISEFGRLELGYGDLTNMTNGGEGVSGREPWNKGVPRTDDVKNKLKIANTGKTYSEEVNKSKGRKGRVSGMKGKHQSKESNEKRRKALLGKPCPSRGRLQSAEQRKATSERTKGCKRSEEFKKNLSIRMQGNTFHFGKKEIKR